MNCKCRLPGGSNLLTRFAHDVAKPNLDCIVYTLVFLPHPIVVDNLPASSVYLLILARRESPHTYESLSENAHIFLPPVLR